MMLKRIVAFFVENPLIVTLVSIAILISGTAFLFSANREAFPKIDFDWVIVETIYPGATATDVEKLISIPIEDQIREVSGIKTISTISLEARSVMSIQLDPDLKDKAKTINDLKNAIDRTEDLPEDSKKPVVTELTMEQIPIISISVINKNGTMTEEKEKELRHYAKILENNLRDIEGVATVSKEGYRDREMHVEISPSLLDSQHISVTDVMTALARKNINFPAGLSRKKNRDILIRTVGEVETKEDIGNIFIRSNDVGLPVLIKDVAVIKDTLEKEEVINATNGAKSITLTVLKKENFDIIDLVSDVKKKVSELEKIFPTDISMFLTDDLSYYVKRRLDVLVGNGISGFILVGLCLFLSLGWRISLVTTISLPLSFCATFIWMNSYDVTINLISMFGLIMVLGMLVDNGIIVGENIYRYLENRHPLKESVIEGTREVIMPIAGTVLTTIAAFLPLMYMKGILGKFIWSLPAIVCVALMISWIESMIILPSQIYEIEKKNHQKRLGEKIKESRLKLRRRYSSLLRLTLHHRWIFMIITTVVFIGSLLFAVEKIKFILFPGGGIEKFIVKAEAKSGTPVEEMNLKMKRIDEVINTLPKSELESFVTRAGIISEDVHDPFSKRGSNYGSTIVNLTPAQSRGREAQDIIESLRKKSTAISNLFTKLEFVMIKDGPPADKPVSVTIKGDDFATLQKIADSYKSYLGTIPGLKDIQDNFEEKKSELKVQIKQDIASRAGITVMDIAYALRACYEGSIATDIKKSDEKIDIRVIFPKGLREDLSSLEKIKVSNMTGQLIPLKNIATFEESEGISVINRKDWRRNITVTSEIDEKAKDVTSVFVNSRLRKHFANIEKDFPGINVGYEGEFKETSESVTDLMNLFIIAILGIYLILVALFKNLHHPLIIVGVIPLSFIGIVWSFYLHNLPLSFMALLGIIGLAGVVVNDSIIYVDFINNLRKKGVDVTNAIIESGYVRFRPVILTTLTTVLGLLPTAYGLGGYDPFLVPLCISFSWGLAFGTLITLFGTPVLYSLFESAREFISKKGIKIERENGQFPRIETNQ